MQIAIVTNTLAGSGKAVKLSNKIRDILHQRKITALVFTETEWGSHIYDFDQVWIIGGDGTVNYFVNQFNDIKKPLCIFKGGTGNDFHALLYGTVSLEDQVALILRSPSRPIDAGKCNDHYFLNGVGIGFDAAVAKSLRGVNKFGGKTFFLISILKHIFLYKDQSYSISSAERTIKNSFLMISAANGTRYGGGFFVAPVARPDDGLLDIILVNQLSRLQRLRYLPVIEKGKHLSLPFIDHFTTNKIFISSNQPIQAHLDGEYLESKELTIEILPSHFNFIY